jgi:excisionase family DNA binding protein
MELLRVEQVAKKLQLGTATVYRLCQRGEIPSVRIGTAVRIPAGALDEWLQRQIQPPRNDAGPTPLHRPKR